MARKLLPPASSLALGVAAMVVVVWVVVAMAVAAAVVVAVLRGATAVVVGKLAGREGAGTLEGGAAGEAAVVVARARAGRVAVAVAAMECSTLPSTWSRHRCPQHNWRPMTTSSRTERRALEEESAVLVAGPGAMAAVAARGERAARPVVREATEEAGAMRAEVSVVLVAGAARVGASAGLAGLAGAGSTGSLRSRCCCSD